MRPSPGVGFVFRGSGVRPVFAVPGKGRHRCPPVAGVKAGASFPDRRLRGRLASSGLCPRRFRRAGGAGICLRPSTRRTNLSAYALDDSLSGRLAGFSICGGAPGLPPFLPVVSGGASYCFLFGLLSAVPGRDRGGASRRGIFSGRMAALRTLPDGGRFLGRGGGRLCACVPVMIRLSGAALHRKSRRNVNLRRLAVGGKVKKKDPWRIRPVAW